MMKTSMLYRLAGGTLIVGAVLAAATMILELFVSPYNPYGAARQLGAPVHVVKFIAVLVFVLGLAGAYLRQAERAGLIGLAAFVALFLGVPLSGLPHSVIEITLDPSLNQEQAAAAFDAAVATPYFGVMSSAGLLLVLLGMVLFPAATLRAKVFPAWVGILGLVSIVVAIASGILSGLLPGIVPHPPTFIFLGFVGYGYWLAAQGVTAELPLKDARVVSI